MIMMMVVKMMMIKDDDDGGCDLTFDLTKIKFPRTKHFE